MNDKWCQPVPNKLVGALFGDKISVQAIKHGMKSKERIVIQDGATFFDQKKKDGVTFPRSSNSALTKSYIWITSRHHQKPVTDRTILTIAISKQRHVQQLVEQYLMDS